jgi:hypothetical protein
MFMTITCSIAPHLLVDENYRPCTTSRASLSIAIVVPTRPYAQDLRSIGDFPYVGEHSH